MCGPIAFDMIYCEKANVFFPTTNTLPTISGNRFRFCFAMGPKSNRPRFFWILPILNVRPFTMIFAVLSSVFLTILFRINFHILLPTEARFFIFERAWHHYLPESINGVASSGTSRSDHALTNLLPPDHARRRRAPLARRRPSAKCVALESCQWACHGRPCGPETGPHGRAWQA